MNHVDPETLAAWSDGGLPSGERLAVESHLADCPQCRAMAAAFGRTLEASSASAPAVVAPSIAASTKWILPFAAAILITAGVAWKYWPRAEEPVQIAATQAPAPTVAAPVAPPRVEPGVTSESRATSLPTTKAPAKTKTRVAPPAAPAVTAPPPPVAMPAAPPPPVALAAPPPPILPPVGTPQAAANGRVMDLRTEALTVSSNSWRVIQFISQSNARLANTAVAGGGGGRGGGVRMTAPVPPVRWRANTPSSIERSTDNGATWTPVLIVEPPSTLAAGTSPSADVCWFVGNAGVVLLSRDGGPFVRLTFPEPVDLVSITAIDHLQATVVTADGRSLITTDGGRTWRARF